MSSVNRGLQPAVRAQIDAALARESLTFADDGEAVNALVNAYHGYKNAYEAVAQDLGILRMSAGPYHRPGNHTIPHGPSIFVVTLPKSGTVFIGQSLRQSLGYDFTNTLVTPVFTKNIIWPTMAWDFQRGRMVSVSHMQPDTTNIAGIKRVGIKKGVLHIRDPRAALHSWLHFRNSIAKAQAGNIRPGDVGLPVVAEFLALPVEGQIDTLIDSFYEPAVHWIDAWMQVLERDSKLEFLVMTHDLLRTDDKAYFAEVMNFYGLSATIIGRSPKPSSSLPESGVSLEFPPTSAHRNRLSRPSPTIPPFAPRKYQKAARRISSYFVS